MTQKKPLLLGAHISIAGGMHKALERGESIGCNTIQIFTKSNRQWAAKPLHKEEIDEFKKAVKQSSIAPIVAHASYLINLASDNKEIAERSTAALIEELKRCNELSIPYLILHPGSRGSLTPEQARTQVAYHLDKVIEAVPGNAIILLETMAGQGSNISYRFEHIKNIIDQSKHKDKLGVCFDTCHVFAAGYDFRTPQSYQAMWTEFDELIGLNRLKIIHINDSKKDLGSRVDRHEDIGKGKIGPEGFALLFNDPRLYDIPKILETPKDDLKDDLRNMRAIVNLLDDKTRRLLSIEVPKKEEQE